MRIPTSNAGLTIDLVIFLKVPSSLSISKSSALGCTQPLRSLLGVVLILSIPLSVILDLEPLIIDSGILFYVYLPIFENILAQIGTLLGRLLSKQGAVFGFFELFIHACLLYSVFHASLSRVPCILPSVFRLSFIRTMTLSWLLVINLSGVAPV